MADKMKFAAAGWWKKVLTALMCAAVVFFMIAADAPDDENGEEKGPVILPAAIFNKSLDMIKKLPLPLISNSGIEPAAPAPREPAFVKVWITNAKSSVTAKLNSVTGYYSSNGGSVWKSIAMMQDAKDPVKWFGPLPGRARGAVTLVAYDAANDAGGNLVELACVQKKWPPPESYLKSDCLRLDADMFRTCVEDRLPKGCLFSGGAEQPPVDDLPARAGDDLDIVGFRIGFDDKFLYFDMTVQRTIAAGSITPIALNQYSVMIFDAASKDPEPKEGLPLSGVMARFLPMGLTAPDFISPCAAVLNQQGKTAPDAGAVECDTNGPHLFMKVRRDLWGNPFPKELIVYAHTGILREKNFDQFSFVDITGLTRVRLGARSYRISTK